jgi:hypothetical protein
MPVAVMSVSAMAVVCVVVLDVCSLNSVLCWQRQELAKCMRYSVLLLQEGLRRNGRDVEEDVSAFQTMSFHIF